MKIAKIILLFLALLLTNCSGELEQEYGLMYNRQIKKFPTEKQNVSLKHILT